MLLGTGMLDALRRHADDFAGCQLVATTLLHGPGNELVGCHALACQFGHRSLLLWLFPRPRLILALAQIRAQGLRLPLAARCKLGVGGFWKWRLFHGRSFHGLVLSRVEFLCRPHRRRAGMVWHPAMMSLVRGLSNQPRRSTRSRSPKPCAPSHTKFPAGAMTRGRPLPVSGASSQSPPGGLITVAAQSCATDLSPATSARTPRRAKAVPQARSSTG